MNMKGMEKMINNQYLYQLYRSKRYLLLFILILYLLFATSEFFARDPVCFNAWQLITTLVATYGMPTLIFSYIHDRKAIDCYGSLPLSRKELLVTALLFCNLSIFVPLSISFVLGGFLTGFSVELLAYWLTMSFCVVVLVGFNAAIYLLANSIFDGLAMIGAYTFLPIYLGIAISFFLNTFVYGYQVNITEYFLPMTLPANMMMLYSYFEHSFIFGPIALAEVPRYLITLAVYGILAYSLLWRGFKHRKLERAGQPSDGFFAYPLIINLYTVLSLLIATSEVYSYEITKWSDVSQYLFLYILILAVYVVANFIYRKRLYLSFKSLALFVTTVLVSLGLCFAANNSSGFGLAYKFGPDSENYSFELYSAYSVNYLNTMLKASGIAVDQNDYCYLNIATKGKLDEETLTFFNDLRLEAIERHYAHEYLRENWHLSLRDGISESDKHYLVDKYYHYLNIRPLTFEELLKLSKKEELKITIDCSKNICELRNGELIVIESFEDTIYYD